MAVLSSKPSLPIEGRGGWCRSVSILIAVVVGVLVAIDRSLIKPTYAVDPPAVPAGLGNTPTASPTAVERVAVSERQSLKNTRRKRYDGGKENLDGESRPACWPVCPPVVLAGTTLYLERKEGSATSRIPIGQMVADDGGTLLFATSVNRLIVDVTMRPVPLSWSMFSHRDQYGIVWVDPSVLSQLNSTALNAANVVLGSVLPQHARIFAIPCAVGMKSEYRELFLSMDPYCHSFAAIRPMPSTKDPALGIDDVSALKTVARCRTMRGSRPVATLRGEQLIELLPPFPRKDVLMLSSEGFVAEVATSFASRLADFFTIALECQDVPDSSEWMATHELGHNCASLIGCLVSKLSKEYRVVGPQGLPESDTPICGIADLHPHPRRRWCVLSRATQEWPTELVALFRHGAIPLAHPSTGKVACPSAAFVG